MNRGKRILAVANCILNANAKITPYAFYPGANLAALRPFLETGAGLLQLPCPETSYLGLSRWGAAKEQYDVPAFREHCAAILRAPLLELCAYRDAGYELLGILGVNGSPSCGVETTCSGYCGGEIPKNMDALSRQTENLRMVPGMGVFMEVLARELARYGLDVPLRGLDEDPDGAA